QHGGLGVPAQGAKPPRVPGKLVVIHDAPVLGSVYPHYVVVGLVLELYPFPGFSLFPVWGALGPDHFLWHLQRDYPVDRPAAADDLRAIVLDGDLVAEEPRR